jgi:hypothetical protein
MFLTEIIAGRKQVNYTNASISKLKKVLLFKSDHCASLSGLHFWRLFFHWTKKKSTFISLMATFFSSGDGRRIYPSSFF